MGGHFGGKQERLGCGVVLLRVCVGAYEIGFTFFHSSVCEDSVSVLREALAAYAEKYEESRLSWLFRLEVKSLEVKKGVSPETELAELACQFVSRFGAKPFCFPDLERWLRALQSEGIKSRTT